MKVDNIEKEVVKIGLGNEQAGRFKFKNNLHKALMLMESGKIIISQNPGDYTYWNKQKQKREYLKKPIDEIQRAGEDYIFIKSTSGKEIN